MMLVQEVPDKAIDDETKAKMIRGLITESGDKIFSIVFVKKDKSERLMICRRHVKKGVKGTLHYDRAKSDKDHRQITVFDMMKSAFRKINLNTVKRMKVKGSVYEFFVEN